MSQRLSAYLLGVAAVLPMVWACSTEPEQHSSRSVSNARRVVGEPTADGSGDVQAQPRCENDICDVKPDVTPAKTKLAEAPSSWCAQAAGTQIGSQRLGELLATLCKDGVATSYMIDTLVPRAFTGSGEPQLFAVKPIDNSNKMVSTFFAVAIKMPIKAAEHFERVAPRDGSVDTEKGKILAQGGTPASDMKVTPLLNSADKNWARGWLVDSSSTTKTKGFPAATIKIKYSYQLSHYKFDRVGFMYTADITNSVETVKNYQILTAVVDIDNVGYQIMVAKIAADDKGQATKVTEAVKGIASNLVKFLYQQSGI